MISSTSVSGAAFPSFRPSANLSADVALAGPVVYHPV
jgi:hypothetical protein